jgi:hypothetical protein
MRPAGKTKLPKCIGNGCEQAAFEFFFTPAKPVEWNYRVNRQLTGPMENCPAAARNPANGQLPPSQLVGGEADISPGSLSPHGNQPGMFAEQDRRFAVKRSLLSKLPLQIPTGQLINLPQQVECHRAVNRLGDDGIIVAVHGNKSVAGRVKLTMDHSIKPFMGWLGEINTGPV